MQTTDLTGGRIPGATRIDSCCWLDGNYDQLIIEFWAWPGSIARTEYDRGTTSQKIEFMDVRSEEYERMLEYAREYL